jgi:type II secretory pathway component PulL
MCHQQRELGGTPACISLGADISSSIETLNFQFERKELISLITLAENANFDSLYSKPEFQVVSKAVSISKNTAAIDILLLKFKVTVNFMHCSVVL